jgi:hypothetical protein
MSTSVTVDVVDDAEPAAYNVKIGTDTFEVNVIVSAADMDRLKQVRDARWEAGSLRVGTTWQIGLHLPIDTIDDVLREIADAAGESSRQ